MLTYSSWRHSSLAREMAVFFMCELIICSLSFNVVSGHGGHIYGNEAWKIQVGLFFRVMSAVSLMSARLNCYNKILPKVLRQQAKAVVIQRFRSEGSHLTSVTWDLGLTGHYNGYVSVWKPSTDFFWEVTNFQPLIILRKEITLEFRQPNFAGRVFTQEISIIVKKKLKE